MNLSAFSLPAWFLAAIAGLYVGIVLWQFVGKRVLVRSRDQERLDQITATGDGAPVGDKEELELLLERAGVSMSAATFRTLRASGAVLAAILGPVVGFPWLVGGFLGVAIWVGSTWWLRERIRGRALRMEKELPNALSRLAALISLETDPPKLLMMVADSLEAVDPTSPLAQEFRRTAVEYREMRVEAFERLEARAPTPALATVALNLRVFANAGGEMGDVIADGARRLQRILNGRNKARIKATDAMTGAKMLPLMLIGVSAFLLHDPMIRSFFSSLLGQLVLAVVAGMMFVGYQLMKRMVEEVV